MTNRYAQVMKRLSPRKSASFARIASIASSAAWCATSVSSGPLTGVPADRLLTSASAIRTSRACSSRSACCRSASAPAERRRSQSADSASSSRSVGPASSTDATLPAPGVLYRVTGLIVPPSAVQADELLSHARRKVIGRDASGQRDDSAHLGEILGAVRAVREVRLEPAALRL